MTGASAIEARGLGKAYRAYPSARARLSEWVLPWRGPRHALRWVLNDLDLAVPRGQALGIVGRNGAGKSTLLKLVARTLQPTTGSLSVSGQVNAVLELGLGFHQDLTGRENVRLAGRLAGMDTREIDRLIPAIAAFAELGTAIDAPLRTYSTGMQARLGFSLATARRPNILIVDEALSVGDDAFQHKSFDRIRAFRRQGTTLLLVSHAGQSIMSVCDRAVLLERGRLIKDADPETVFDVYNALLAGDDEQQIRQVEAPGGGTMTVSGSGEVRIDDVSLTDWGGSPIAVAEVGAGVVLQVRARASEDVPSLVVGFLIKDRFGQPIYGTNTAQQSQTVGGLRAGESVTLRAAMDLRIGAGSYSIAVALHATETHLERSFDWRDRALLFKVVNPRHAAFVGSSWLEPRLEIER
ncbi:ABC transporter ATP-binding protein [uncultured Thiohalocapsa sp.]|uniref:ABC transporter ATP-binding protein n=1 Tax=uncultured Thiohalocapsa sp. TaxID=768990 RepID=UPI0025CF1531|nr:ABC transporter ATP-binding protein [uncultured Thiohalocapsa sp.]